MAFSYSFSAESITLSLAPERAGLLRSLLAKPKAVSLSRLEAEDQDVLFAIADLREISDRLPGQVDIAHDQITLSHKAAASLPDRSAHAIGIPSSTNRTLKTDVVGMIGNPDFRLSYEWSRNGIQEFPRRTGAILHTSEGDQRIPLWMMQALDLADRQDGNADLPQQWAALAQFRQALEPEEYSPGATISAKIAMTDFLKGLEVRIANRFSLAPTNSLHDFEVVPFSSQQLTRNGVTEDEICEVDAELEGQALAAFQYELRSKGARAAYRVADRGYLVIDPASAPVLEEISRAQRDPEEARKDFIANPRARITQAVSMHLDEAGQFEGLNDAEQEELVESLALPGLIETREYSERVTGVVVYKPDTSIGAGSGTTWLPEVFSASVVQAIGKMDRQELESLHSDMKRAKKTNEAHVTVAGEQVPVQDRTIGAVEAEMEARSTQEEKEPKTQPEIEEGEEKVPGPIILGTVDNSEQLEWFADLAPRKPAGGLALPSAVTTALKQHQTEGFNWAVDAWCQGLPGILNADEQGLGKTLQTIAFLSWLKEQTAVPTTAARGPILVVAPTSLLVNWEEEVVKHLERGGFGHLVRLYGSHLSSQIGIRGRGKETDTGKSRLDLAWIDEAFQENRAHRYWFLTTYTTLTNYQHSLASIPFSAMVFDEIQALKNPTSLRSKAALAMRADFRMGLTGTPIENATTDLWAIMEQLSAGALGSRRDFSAKFSQPDEENMNTLYDRVFRAPDGRRPLALRRLKEDAARDLPEKTRMLYPRLMPDIQAAKYEEARVVKAGRSKGAALKMLHHIRSVSVHPYLDGDHDDNDFINDSARLQAVMDTLSDIRNKGERALVFIEHLKMQYRFAELVKREFNLSTVEIINGSTAIPKRQQIVNTFQKSLSQNGGFDLLVLGPKAAGTGLTLTAATHVIHLSRWWNPAVEEQCNDRVHRIGQTRPVTVHIPMAIHSGFGAGSFDCLLQSLMQKKRRMASAALWPMGDTSAEAEGLQREVFKSSNHRQDTTLLQAVSEMFERDGLKMPKWRPGEPLVLPD